jgi:hypothetical protein
MEKLNSYKVKEASINEFASKWFASDGRDDRRNQDCTGQFHLIGRETIMVKKEIMEVIKNDPAIEFEISDESRRFGTPLKNTYQYSIEPYDDVCLKLLLIDSSVELAK